MAKYFQFFKASWQKSVEYRFDFFAHLLRGIITLAVMLFIFKAVFKETNDFKGYTFASMFTYLVMTKILHFTTRGNTARDIGNEIKDGTISIYLIKPLSYLKTWFSFFLANRLFEVLIRIGLAIVFFFFFPLYLNFPRIDHLLLFVLFLGIALTFNFIFNALHALTAFWVTDIRLFSTVIGLTIGFLAGEVIPLDVLPTTLRKISSFLPFQYSLYFPIKLYQGTFSSSQILKGLIVSFVWIGAGLWLLRKVWRKGIRKYEAIGQ